MTVIGQYARVIIAGVFVAALWGLDPSDVRAQDTKGTLSLGLPIRCTPGNDCWVANYVDADPTRGIQDYRCGVHTYDGHKGTDIAIRDLAAMRKGFPVIAAAPGVVVGTRDGMADVDMRRIGGRKALKGKDCGNGVHVRHGEGWTIQYCHLRKGSVTVRTGDKVAAGQQLGMVGLSGRTVFPHVHITVRHGKTVVDPFVGLAAEKCSLGNKPLWKPKVLAQLGYRPVQMYHAGIAGNKPTLADIRDGRLNQVTIPRDAPALFLWFEAFWVQPGDTMVFSITDPNGRAVLRGQKVLKSTKKVIGGRSAYIFGRKRKAPAWPAGDYKGEVRVIRDKGKKDQQEFTITSQVTVR